MKKSAQKIKQDQAFRREHRTRTRIAASGHLRLSVHRTSKHIYAQIIDDGKAVTLVAAHDTEIKDKKLKGIALAEAVGKLVAEKALAKKITTVVFDKGKFKYHGRLKSLAEGARQVGLKF